MKVTRRKMFEEAIDRMRLLGISEEEIYWYKCTGVVRVVGDPEALAALPIERSQAMAKSFEGMFSSQVYLIWRRMVDGDVVDSYIHVDDDDVYWEFKREELTTGDPHIVFFHNWTSNEMDFEFQKIDWASILSQLAPEGEPHWSMT